MKIGFKELNHRNIGFFQINSNLPKHLVILIIFNLFFVSFVQGQDLSQARELCSNLTAANRAMAEKAGYDVDKVCGEINSATKNVKPIVQVAPKVERATSSGTKSKPNINSVSGSQFNIAPISSSASENDLINDAAAIATVFWI